MKHCGTRLNQAAILKPKPNGSIKNNRKPFGFFKKKDRIFTNVN